MTTPEQLQSVGDRIESLLEQLGSLPDRRARQLAEELLRVVTDLYGAGLERVVELACSPGAVSGRPLLEVLASDELVSSLLALHDLHPLSVEARIARALEALSPSLGAADVRLLSSDGEVARVRVLAEGWPGSSRSLENLVRRTVEEAAPEIAAVEIDRPVMSQPVALRRRKAAG